MSTRAPLEGRGPKVASGGSGWLREEPGAVVLAIRAQPGARRSEFAGVHGDALRIRLAAPPVDGRANDELVRFLAEAFGVPRARVTLLRGASSRAKLVRIDAPATRPAWLSD